MNERSELDDLKYFVGRLEPDPETSSETARFIEEYKKRPEYALEVEEADRILAAVGIDPRAYGMQNAQSLLEHWQRCVEQLSRSDPAENHGEAAPDPTDKVAAKSTAS